MASAPWKIEHKQKGATAPFANDNACPEGQALSLLLRLETCQDDYFIVTLTPLAETTFSCRPWLRDVSFMTTPFSFLRCRPLTPTASATPD
jgi:hypothetical protein